jgi:hypothetical protein
LNRSGDRQLNRALHAIVLVRMRQDSTTKDYVQRRLAAGKSIREIKRCLNAMSPGSSFASSKRCPQPVDRT